jgi:hypothetical protein
MVQATTSLTAAAAAAAAAVPACVNENAAVPFKTRHGLPSKYVIAQVKESLCVY